MFCPDTINKLCIPGLDFERMYFDYYCFTQCALEKANEFFNLFRKELDENSFIRD